MKNKYKIILLTLLLTLVAYQLSFGQPTPTNTNTTKTITGEFRKVSLGMNREEVLDALLKDGLLEIDEYSEFGDFDEENKFVLKAKSLPQIDNIYYQFYKENDTFILYTITIHFNPKYFSYFELYKSLYEKYGKADKKIPNKSQWGLEDVEKFKMILVRTGLYPNYNLSLKFIDKEGLQKAIKNKPRIETQNMKTKKELLLDSL